MGQKKRNKFITFLIALVAILCGIGLGRGSSIAENYLENGYKQLGVRYWGEEETDVSFTFCEECVIVENHALSYEEDNLISSECEYKGNEVYVDDELLGKFTNTTTFVLTIEHVFYTETYNFVII